VEEKVEVAMAYSVFAQIKKIGRKRSRLWMQAVILLSDLFSLFLAFYLAVVIRLLLPGSKEALYQYFNLYPIIVIFIIVYAWRGLYSTVGLNPVEELRHLTEANSIVFLLLIALTFWLQEALNYSRLVLAFAWVLSIVIVQFNRWLFRNVVRRMIYWGEPVVIIGNGKESQYILEYLKQNIRLGIRPEVIVDGKRPLHKAFFSDMNRRGIRTAILVTTEVTKECQQLIANERSSGFQHLILVSSLGWIGSLGVIPRDLEGILAFEIRQNLLHAWDRFIKRLMDFLILMIGIVFVVPLMMVVALLIKIDSPGPILYRQERVGKDGKPIQIWKFRTMVANADQILEDQLQRSPLLRKEWEITHKLKNDLRITKIGRILRKLSIDEFPQLWNVVKGEMSIVGPRPIVPNEISKYKHIYVLYTQVKPGLTGLWQVSGRNDRSYETRVRYDEYYIRNWSIWLDVYIMLRTIWVVATGKGAY
jgi:Undecaprenyl-phosphate galactose phosphotransferase WbaP